MSIDIEIKGETKVNCDPYNKKNTVYFMARRESDYVEEPVGWGYTTSSNTDTADSGEYDIDRHSEEVSSEVEHGDYISRCHYGSLVINTKDVFIADVDISGSSKYPQLRSKEKFQEYFLRITPMLRNNFLLYETKNGFRVIMVSDVCNPTSDLSQKYMELFLADKLYSHNCVYQECYRARLTPKPNRVGMRNLDSTEGIFYDEERWIKEYDKLCEDYIVCRLKAVSAKTSPMKYSSRVLDFIVLHNDYTTTSFGYELA